MKGYNRENFLKRVIEMKKHFDAHYINGQTIQYAYDTYIKPSYHISKKTFEKWMKIPAETQLKNLYHERENKSKAQQIAMDFAKEPV